MDSGPVVRVVDTEFNEFLYAPIGEEGNGMTLSVVSALARQDLDPWAHATYLSGLPWQTAVHELALLIGGLPAGLVPRPAPEAIATRLIALLPQRSDARPRRALPQYVATFSPASWLNMGRVLLAYLCSLLISLWIIAALHRPPPVDKPVTPSDARVATVQQMNCQARRACRGRKPAHGRSSNASAN